MQKKEHVSMPVIRRLPRYYRFLKELEDKGETKISSKELSRRMGFTASQIRQDFNCFGGFGQQGYGYNIPLLCDEIRSILGIKHEHPCILVGAGNLGTTIVSHMAFERSGFHLKAVFDKNEALFGQSIQHFSIKPINQVSDYIQREKIVMAILCVPKVAAYPLVQQLYTAGIKAYWNFSHYDISIDYPDVIVENVHLNDSIMTLCYKITEQQQIP